MITNDSQYNVTQRAAEDLRGALCARDDSSVVDIPPALIEAHWAGVADELACLERQLAEYQALKAGTVRVRAESLADLPEALIRARIARGLTQKGLAEMLELKTQQIQRYESERYKSASFSRIITIARLLGVDIDEGAPDDELIDELPADLFPVAEMAKRGWFEDFSGTHIQAKRQAETLLPGFFKSAGMFSNQLVYHRRTDRKLGRTDDASLLAWEARVRSLALRNAPSTPFSVETITDEWVRSLVSLSTLTDGPLRAINELLNAGIKVVYEPPLTGTRLDGAALLVYTGTPVIGLTMRYDRIDYFWFTLLHELGHVKLHLGELRRSAILDDLEEDADNAIESEADLFSQEALIPASSWTKCLSRFSRSEKAVIRDAAALSVHPAIVAGRVRKEAADYTILTSLVGASEVRNMLRERLGNHEAA